MPILTDDELNNLHKEISSKDSIIDQQVEMINKLKETDGEHEQQRKLFLTLLIVAVVLLAIFVGISYSSPSTLGISAPEKPSLENTTKVDSLQQIVSNLELEKQELEGQLANRNSSVELEAPVTYFAVQIGAFERFNTPLVSDDFLLIKGDKNYYLNSYSVGMFKTLKEAKALKKALQQMGFKDAFTAKYKNAKRIDILE